MAEAFGLAAGVLQVAGFGAEVGGALFKCARKLHNASKELEAIAGQVEVTALSLRRVDELLKDPSTKALHTPKLFEDTNTVSEGCNEVFRELHRSIQTFDARSNGGKMKFLSRTRWLFDSGRLMELGKVLRHYNDVLHLMVSVMTIVEGRRAATKDELQALEADLQLLAVSNKDLSHSNKTLTETLAAITRAPKSPSTARTRDSTPPTPLMHSTATTSDGHTSSPFIALAAMSHVNSIQTPMPKRPTPDPMSDHLRRCMDSVQELAKTIAGAMDVWHGKTNESFDVHGSFSRLTTQVQSLPNNLECVHCARVVTWTDFKLPKPEPDAAGTCVCTRNSSRTLWGPCNGMPAVSTQSHDPTMHYTDLNLGVGATGKVGCVDASLIQPYTPLGASDMQCVDIPSVKSSQSWVYPLMPSPSAGGDPEGFDRDVNFADSMHDPDDGVDMDPHGRRESEPRRKRMQAEAPQDVQSQVYRQQYSSPDPTCHLYGPSWRHLVDHEHEEVSSRRRSIEQVPDPTFASEVAAAMTGPEKPRQERTSPVIGGLSSFAQYPDAHQSSSSISQDFSRCNASYLDKDQESDLPNAAYNESKPMGYFQQANGHLGEYHFDQQPPVLSSTSDSGASIQTAVSSNMGARSAQPQQAADWQQQFNFCPSIIQSDRHIPTSLFDQSTISTDEKIGRVGGVVQQGPNAAVDVADLAPKKRKRSFTTDLDPEPGLGSMSTGRKRSKSDRTNRTSDISVDPDTHTPSKTKSCELTAVQMLLERWIDGDATAMLLEAGS